MADCPRCRQALVQHQVDEFSLRLCSPCKGLLLPQADMATILERSWRSVSPDEAEKVNFVTPEHWQGELVLHCPDCGSAMEKYGYMGLAALRLDRCEPCGLFWLDAEELEGMVLALAKTNYRSQRALKREQEGARDITSVGMRSFGGFRGDPGAPELGLHGVSIVAQVLLRLLR